METVLRTKSLAVGYEGRALISGIEISVREGEILTLIGPNGAGKSTILKSLARQLALVSGEVYLFDQPMSALSGDAVAKQMSVLLTGRTDTELMTCREAVSAGRYPYTGRLGILSETDRRKVREAMALVHVEELAERDFARISDGQRQRVLLARAICQAPKVLVMDEPTSFLDIRHKLELLSILKELVQKKHLAVVLSLHELDLAQKISDRLLCIRAGRVDALGSPEEIFSGHYIEELYDVARGSYNEMFGCLELAAPAGEAEIFVIGGGGSGVPIYRRLAREGRAFFAGVLHENDLDLPTARLLARQVITEAAYTPVSERTFSEAAGLMKRCPVVFCPLDAFGPMNEANRRLRELAAEWGTLSDLTERSDLL